ncbi:hypothetical protein CDAR_286061 [Caerostris darwini]|uniref:Uncharacterized protein n=1 Tax=Caerostris darwini TaxID=1538125 RepID=A0AAV4N2K2_9ARAC|nr:hypothetical protein CDAR_286061 [Caerostris darwini]
MREAKRKITPLDPVRIERTMFSSRSGKVGFLRATPVLRICCSNGWRDLHVGHLLGRICRYLRWTDLDPECLDPGLSWNLYQLQQQHRKALAITYAMIFQQSS